MVFISKLNKSRFEFFCYEKLYNILLSKKKLRSVINIETFVRKLSQLCINISVYFKNISTTAKYRWNFDLLMIVSRRETVSDAWKMLKCKAVESPLTL